uniref:Isochorismatase domain containing 2 n=1 Tax=Apteryx owenii TaxID=8824 RepID=A0A8B9PZN0_APTOW
MVTGRPGLYGLDSGGPGLYGFWAGGPDLYGFGPGGPNLYAAPFDWLGAGREGAGPGGTWGPGGQRVLIGCGRGSRSAGEGGGRPGSGVTGGAPTRVHHGAHACAGREAGGASRPMTPGVSSCGRTCVAQPRRARGQVTRVRGATDTRVQGGSRVCGAARTRVCLTRAGARRAAMAGARLGKVTPGSSILFLCDMQERFRPSVAFFPQIVAVAARLLQACRELGVPAVVTEQHPRALGPTVPELGAHDLPKHPKTCFSMVVPAVEAELRARPGLASVLLCGIETQACILVRPRGGAQARSQVDRLVALGRLRQSGAFLTTSESLILQLLRDAAHPRFRQVQQLIKEPAPDSGLLGLLGGPGVLPGEQ